MKESDQIELNYVSMSRTATFPLVFESV
jgi:hypothetical protein